MQSYPAAAQGSRQQASSGRRPGLGAVRGSGHVRGGAVVTVIQAVIFLATASGALGPATWIARTRTATTLRAE